MASQLVKSATMSDVPSIHAGRAPVRRHFLKEWLEHKGLSVPDLLVLLNDDERSMDLPRIDKSQAYRWMKGQLPQAPTQRRIADVLGLEDPADLLRPPEDDWFVRFFSRRSEAELRRVRDLLEAAFPDEKTGTDG